VPGTAAMTVLRFRGAAMPSSGPAMLPSPTAPQLAQSLRWLAETQPTQEGRQGSGSAHNFHGTSIILPDIA